MRRFLQKTISLVLLLNLILPNFSKANTLSDFGEQYKSISRPVRQNSHSLATRIIKPAKDVVAHQGQALILILMLTGVEIVRNEMHLAGVRKENVDPQLILKYSADAAEHILKSGEIWSSIIGAGVTSTAMSKPLRALDGLIQNSKSRPILKNLISNGIGTLVVFLGWELGGQLFTEARELIEDDEEYARAEYVLPLLMSLVKGTVKYNQPDIKKDIETLKTLCKNMVTILITNHEFRNLWLYNAFRHRIATGEFATLVMSMVAAMAVGTAIFPGAGTIAGLMFGLVGGVLTIFIPQKSKDWLTERFRSMRETGWMAGREGYGLFEFLNHIETVIKISSKRAANQEEMPPMLDFIHNPRSTNGILSIYFERLMGLESNLQVAVALRNEANRYKNTENEKKYNSIIWETKKEYNQTLADLLKVYASDLTHLEQLFTKYDYFKLMNNPQVTNRYPLVKKIAEFYSRLKKVKSFIENDFIKSVQNEMMNSSDQKEYLYTLQKLYIFGYDEDEVYGSLVNIYGY